MGGWIEKKTLNKKLPAKCDCNGNSTNKEVRQFENCKTWELFVSNGFFSLFVWKQIFVVFLSSWTIEIMLQAGPKSGEC